LAGFFLTIFSVFAILVVHLLMRYYMFESLEIRKAANGFILVLHTEEDTKEFVYDTERKLMRVIKSHLGEKITDADKD